MKSVKQKQQDVAPPVSALSRSCSAFGCPEAGSISSSNAGEAPPDSWFCRFHFGEPASNWPEITRQRRLARENDPPGERPQEPVTSDHVLRVRRDMARLCRGFGLGPKDPKAWARRLKAREEAGAPLSEAQRDAWRTALRSKTSDVEGV